MAKFTVRKSGSQVEISGVRPSELKAMAEAGELSPKDEIRKDGTIEWHLASTVNGLEFNASEEVLKHQKVANEYKATVQSLQEKELSLEVSKDIVIQIARPMVATKLSTEEKKSSPAKEPKTLTAKKKKTVSK